MLVIPPGFAQVSLKISLTGDPETIYMTHGIDLSDAGGDIPGVLARIDDAFMDTPSPRGVMASVYKYLGARLAIGQDGGPPVIAESSQSAAGGYGGAPLPQNCALLVKKRTGLAGREGRGRIYQPGIPENQVDAVGALDSTALADGTAAWSGYLSALSAAAGGAISGPPVPMVLLHTDPQAGVTPGPTPVTSLVVDSRIATQRRRLR